MFYERVSWNRMQLAVPFALLDLKKQYRAYDWQTTSPIACPLWQHSLSKHVLIDRFQQKKMCPYSL